MIFGIGFLTLAKKECLRIFRIWMQTLIPSPLMMILYLLTFGRLVDGMDKQPYAIYIIPGLIMMSIVSNSFANVVSSFFMAKFQRNIEEILISPMSSLEIMMGFISGGVVRGMLNGLTVFILCYVCVSLKTIHNPVLFICFSVMLSYTMSCLGLINGICAKKFDDINFIPTFFLNPLMYLSGVFYSIKILSPFWNGVVKMNPLFYCVSALRFSLLGQSDVSPYICFYIIFITAICSSVIAWRLLEKRSYLSYD